MVQSKNDLHFTLFENGRHSFDHISLTDSKKFTVYQNTSAKDKFDYLYRFIIKFGTTPAFFLMIFLIF